jgi:hypothetical protein
MNNKIKKYLKLSAIFLVGAAIGAGATLYWASSTFESLHYITVLFINAENEEEAYYLYKNAPPAIAIYKLDRTISKMESFENTRAYNNPHDKKGLNWDKGLLQGRLGKLYKNTGNDIAASEHLNKSLNHFSQFGWKLKDENEVLKAIEMLDTNKVTQVIKSIGETKDKK